MNNFLLAKESFPFLAVSGIIGVILYLINPWASLLPGIFILFCLFFFRNPNRNIISDAKAALSPADGVIMDITKANDAERLDGEVWKVTIFLSIFNVHFNRTPTEGVVESISYVPGKFFPAFKSHASGLNERNYVVFNTQFGRIMVCQITGFIARRIVCWAKKGDAFLQGERFGMIKFGSCTEIYLPLKYLILVKKGDKVKGGLTVIGRID
ncbi:MAG: phosphatidylserine decarboxylase family protein [Desulfitobacteriaceae bacterium]|nr:phosphatidylserine decarboxylase family protein [Desulfitobacteriaceae bacterium]MDD4752190.1 phosphatidylserine decarboxylase family protein [Desulfitobacteriaceae bacterium]